MTLADEIPRRRFLEAGGRGLLGMGLAGGLWPNQLPAAEAAVPGSPAIRASFQSFAKAKSVIVLFLYGAPSQMDTLDPKPDAPAEMRGDFKTIASSIPGIRASELLPNTARNLHRLGFDPHQTRIPDRSGRPIGLTEGSIVRELLA
jgi:hypothetical protein